MYTNAGKLDCNQQADLYGYPEPVWFNEKAITNIIPFHKVESSARYKVEYIEKQGFKVTNHLTGNVNIFISNGGLYTATPNSNSALQFVETVEDNKKDYSKAQVKRAEQAQKLYRAVGYPSIQ